MIDSVLYLVGVRKDTGEYEEEADSCQLCKKMIINAGIKQVIIREDKSKYKIVNVEEWVENDELLDGKTTY